MDITQNDIEIYLTEVKDAIRKNRYRIERNYRRQDNTNLFLDYLIDETMAKDILLGLTATDFPKYYKTNIEDMSRNCCTFLEKMSSFWREWVTHAKLCPYI